ncbi:MAG TPA: DUF4419 domain-containing protein [Kofleriaceae bacterium]|jgi:hypothetical protein|nr:DUF4419 domain-containing protein [Kofleriaceae bacterium]
MRTFPVSAVEVAAKRRGALDRATAIPKLLNKRVEQVYASKARLVACTDVNPLVQMVHDAFYEHRPIAISPDAVWFTIGHGFATHVNANAEALRHRFVKHDGKVKLVVERTDFAIGSNNPWPEAFAAFSDQIAGHVGKLRDLIVADFSTTGPIERAATEVLVMDTFQSYFEYEMLCGCGIPSVTLLGTPDDWRSIRRRAQMLSEYDLAWWTDALLPVLDKLVATAEGQDDPGFWQSLFHENSSSVGSAINGWIHVLFPYIQQWGERGEFIGPNPHLATWQRDHDAGRKTGGPGITQLGSGLASAPVKLVDLATREEHHIRFVGGMFGVVDDGTGVLSTEFGWAIVHD